MVIFHSKLLVHLRYTQTSLGDLKSRKECLYFDSNSLQRWSVNELLGESSRLSGNPLDMESLDNNDGLIMGYNGDIMGI